MLLLVLRSACLGPPDGHDDANTVLLTPVLEDAARVLGQKSRQCCEFLVRQDTLSPATVPNA